MGQKTGTAGPSENAEDTKNVMAAEFQYDNQGNLLRDERAEYAVDVRNRVVKAELFDGNIQINRYDAEGLRAEVEENGRLTSFVFDGTEAVMEETEGETVRYIRGYRNRIIASDCESARQYYHYACDELGSVTHVIIGCGDGECGQRQDERVQNTYEYDAFGNQVKCEENVSNRFCFAGEQYDAVTQQYYLRARFYNPVIGRFTQEDSYHGDGLNLYAYCHNNPMYYVDPSGHDVRAAAEKDFVNKALDAMNGYADKGIDAMMKEAYGSGDGPGPSGGRPTEGQGFSAKGYNPKPGERTLKGYVEQNADPEVPLYTNSSGFNNNNGNTGGQFKRFGAESGHGIDGPHVHQPIRNVAPDGSVFGDVGSKTKNGGVTSPTAKDVKQLYEYLNNNKYHK